MSDSARPSPEANSQTRDRMPAPARIYEHSSPTLTPMLPIGSGMVELHFINALIVLGKQLTLPLAAHGWIPDMAARM